MGYGSWNRGLLLGALLIVVAGMTLVAATTRRQRLLAVGMALQAIMLILVFNGAFHRQNELSSVAVVPGVVFAAWCLMSRDDNSNDVSSVPSDILESPPQDEVDSFDPPAIDTGDER